MFPCHYTVVTGFTNKEKMMKLNKMKLAAMTLFISAASAAIANTPTQPAAATPAAATPAAAPAFAQAPVKKTAKKAKRTAEKKPCCSSQVAVGIDAQNSLARIGSGSCSELGGVSCHTTKHHAEAKDHPAASDHHKHGGEKAE